MGRVGGGEQPPRRDRTVTTLDAQHLRRTEQHGVLDQSGGGVAAHDAAVGCYRFHALSHAHLFADRGVAETARAHLAGDHLARVETDPDLQTDPGGKVEFVGQPVALVLQIQRREAGP